MSEATLTATKTYNIDPAHATIRFWVRHMMVAKVHGELSELTGVVVFDPQNPDQTTVQATIQTASLSTGNAQRDGHLKSADFLDVEKSPTIEFKSNKVVPTGDGQYDVVGDLTIHGTTREVTLKAEATPEVKGHFGGYVVGVSATTVIDRDDFGITWNQAMETGGVLVGKEIHIQIDAELQRAE